MPNLAYPRLISEQKPLYSSSTKPFLTKIRKPPESWNSTAAKNGRKTDLQNRTDLQNLRGAF